MAGFGETIRQARAHKNVTLREAEAETRINRHHLAALEDEDFTALPPQTYTRGIVRKYAAYLGLDAGKVLDMYREAAGVTREANPAQSVPVEMPRMWAPNFAIVAFGVVLTAIVFAWGYSIWLSPTDVTTEPPTQTATTQDATQTSDAPRPTAPAAPTAVVTAPPATEETVVQDGGDNQSGDAAANQYTTGVGVTVTADAAIQIQVDGQIVFDDVLGAGTETELFVGTDFSITTSDDSVTFIKNSCGETSSVPMSEIGGSTMEFSASEKSCPAP